MKIGAMLGGAGRAQLEEKIERAEKREIEKKRAREIAKKRRLGKTIRYDRGGE